ncbi:MAG: GGDEF domain-containing protein [candidate division Zixibacteria bacterium]|nr:GGDEF domain-containing protein [candidate division Zixibacteria bacterium]
MLETILIIILSALVVGLSALLLTRHRARNDIIALDPRAVDDLLTAFTNNLRRGKIQDIAGRVSHILKHHLHCDKIIFLRSFKGHLELNYANGLNRLNRNELRLRLNQHIQSSLRASSKIDDISSLKNILRPEYLTMLSQLGLTNYFPVYLKDQLYGLYFIATDLPLTDPSLRFLSMTLAFNLSTAYYMGAQEQQLRQYENKMKSLESSRNKTAEPAEGIGGPELGRLLKIKNSRRLASELMGVLRRDCQFTRMIFYVRPEQDEQSEITVNWHISDGMDKTCRKELDRIMSQIEAGKVCSLDDLGQFDGGDKCLDKLKETDLKYLTTLPWGGSRKALLAWNGRKVVDEVANRLKIFRAETQPLVENARLFEETEAMSYTDGLTGLYNFRFFIKRIGEEIDRARRYVRPLALIIIDIDDLKVVNDKYGHLAGDCLLKAFAGELTASVRSNDIVSRYGGDEFCLIMPETDRDNTRIFMERIRDKIGASPCAIEGTEDKLAYSVSVGGAVYPSDAENAEALIHAADMALLKAKSEGRNRTRLAPERIIDLT